MYLAGDIVFRRKPDAIFDRFKAICEDHGLEGLAPLDGQLELHGMRPGTQKIMAIVAADRDLMDRCDAGLFCLDPFRRAADMDPGTAVEIGYMFAQSKKLEGYSVDARAYPDKVADYFVQAWQVELRDRPTEGGSASGSREDPDGMLVHSEGLLQNGMTEGFIRLSGGDVATDPDLFAAFRIAATRLAGRLLA